MEINYFYLSIVIVNFIIFLFKLLLKRYYKIYSLIFYFLIVESIFLIFAFRIIIINFSLQTETFGILYSMLNSYLIGVFINVLGFSGKQKQIQRIIIFVVASIIMISSASLIGISITINLPFLIEKVFTTNTGQGAVFFISNILLFNSLIIASFLSEGEVKE